MNADRVCGLCARAEITQVPAMDLAAVLIAANSGEEKEAIDKVREMASGCPACVLSAIRLSRKQRPPDEEGDRGVWFDYNYKEEHAAFWKDIHESDREWKGVY